VLSAGHDASVLVHHQLTLGQSTRSVFGVAMKHLGAAANGGNIGHFLACVKKKNRIYCSKIYFFFNVDRKPNKGTGEEPLLHPFATPSPQKNKKKPTKVTQGWDLASLLKKNSTAEFFFGNFILFYECSLK